jgi:hypothetical protein
MHLNPLNLSRFRCNAQPNPDRRYGQRHGSNVSLIRSISGKNRVNNTRPAYAACESKQVCRPSFYPAPTRSSILVCLLHAFAATLNQYDQNDHKKHAGYNPNKCRTIHCDTPFQGFELYPGQRSVRSARHVGQCFAASLLHPCAAALDQNDQHDHKKYAGSDPNQC